MVCDHCKKEICLFDGWLSCPDVNAPDWQFVCKDCPDGFYDIPASRFFHSAGSTIDWLAHLIEKRWFDPPKFFEFMDRLRANGGFYGRA